MECRTPRIHLAGNLNSTPVQDLLASYANTIAISHQTLARLPIPPFDPTSSLAHAVVLASRAASEHANGGPIWLPTRQADALAHQAALDDAVAKLLSLPTEYRPQSRKVAPPRTRLGRAPSSSEQGELFQ